MGKVVNFLFPAQSDQETHMERLPLDIKCLIHEAFLLRHPEPLWQTVLPSKKITKWKEASWLYGVGSVCVVLNSLMSLGKGVFWESSFVTWALKERTPVCPRGEESRGALGSCPKALLGLQVGERPVQLCGSRGLSGPQQGNAGAGCAVAARGPQLCASVLAMPASV